MFVLFNTGKSNNNAIDLHVENDRIVINEQEHLLSDVKARTDFRPYCKMTFPLKQPSTDQRTIKDALGGSHSYPYSLPPFDIFTHTAESKYTQYELSLFTHHSYDVSFIFFPHHITFKDAVLSVLAPTDPNVPLKITTKNGDDIVPYVPHKTISDITGWSDYIFPKCTLEIVEQTVENGVDVYTLEFTYRDIDGKPISCDFYASVKSTKGYLTHRKLDLVDGKVRFKYVPLYVDKGDTSVIQVGIGNYSHIAKIVI